MKLIVTWVGPTFGDVSRSGYNSQVHVLTSCDDLPTVALHLHVEYGRGGTS